MIWAETSEDKEALMDSRTEQEEPQPGSIVFSGAVKKEQSTVAQKPTKERTLDLGAEQSLLITTQLGTFHSKKTVTVSNS